VTGDADTANKIPNNPNPITHAFLYSGGALQDLGALGSGYYSQGYGVNKFGQVVGISSTNSNGSYTAFLYSSSTGMVDLNTLISPTSGWVLGDAQAISDTGYITGYGTIDGQEHAYLLTPAPEPSQFAALGIGALGLAGLMLRARRRKSSPLA
jgi:probable HAF family extracellular repeat protein